ncbi:MAG: alpha/beta fold hydrolase [Promethearchaeota archaeon]|nr:MAG: alpha/beta fold hydrolase [Candidatus Lokiarchaeota archaeon]
MTYKDHRHLRNLLIFIIILIFTLSFLHFNKVQSYYKYERIQFESSGAILYANLYYPSKTLHFQEQRPLIIYCHGIGSKRDFDLRIPIEFTKRGFYVVALDYQGHGESGGNINNIDPITGIPALALDCSKLLDHLESLPFYSNVNVSQIGLIGQSLGGMVVLMNQALDSRFTVTVALAPLVNFVPPKFGFVYNEDFIKYIPVNLLTEENTENLLIIHHEKDEILDFTENALKAQELTNCTVVKISGFIFGGGHQLYSDEVIIKSINWFEFHFFGSSILNGPILISFYLNYVLIFINIIILFIMVISLISISGQIFFRRNKSENFNSLKYDLLVNRSNKKKESIKIFLYIGAFILNWFLFVKIFGTIGILYGSLSMIMIYATIRIYIHLKNPKELRNKYSLKHTIRMQLKLKYLIFIVICVAYFIAIYMLFSFYYPFGFIWPSNFIEYFSLGYLIFPIFLSVELLLRKVIYPHLRYIKHKNIVLVITAIVIIMNLTLLTQKLAFLPSVLFMHLIFLIVIIQNGKILQNVNSFFPVVFISFTIIQIFFAAVLSNAIGVSITI